ncbi:MAG: hypothetical protein KDD45_05550, partial [Bdellovibrionales bacterium]|nr:hypothetical protein [Bdellovibrionales bacterium]
MFKKIRSLLLLTHRNSRKKNRLTLIFFTSLILICLYGTNKLQFLLSIDDLIDPDFQTYSSLKKVNDEFNDKNTVLLSIESKVVFKKEFLCGLQSWILNTAQERTDLIRIQSTFGIRQASVEKQKFQFRSFLDLNCLSQTPENDKILESFEKVKKSPWVDILTTQDNFTITVNFIVHDPKNQKYGSIDIHVVDQLKDSFQNFFKDKQILLKGLSLYWGGVTTYQSYLRKAFDQTQFLNGLMFVFSLLIFRLFLGSWKAGILFNLTILISLIISYGIMGFFKVPVDVLTNST